MGGKADLALATDTINRRQVLRLTKTIADLIPEGGRVAVLGLTYKPNTPVIEESQGVMLAKALHDAGMEVLAHDSYGARSGAGGARKRRKDARLGERCRDGGGCDRYPHALAGLCRHLA